MLKRVLVANRGEIALRIIRSLREMDVETVLVYSEPDKNSLPVITANYAVCIGPKEPVNSYLNENAIIETAIHYGCEAIHPGYGFLSENAEFAKKCEENNIIFIGPSHEVIAMMGNKQAARKLMIENNVPVVPGSEDVLESVEEAYECAEKIGYPVLIKASSGGGGKGMRRVYGRDELEKAYLTAKSEAKAAFGDDSVYMEKLIINPRHIELQVLADHYGNVISLGERNCSIQKNNQKLLEEAPAFGVSEATVKKLNDTAILAAKAAGYNSVGTVEFVMDDDENYYFIEMNTRIQVEHPVTEMVTGIDLVRWQIRVAAGMKLAMDKAEVKGHSIECRINALTSGVITNLHIPSGYGVRVETHLFTGYEITPFYDPMIAKVIVYGDTRLEAVRRLRRVLEELVIEGVKTNEEFMHILTYQKDFIRGYYDTSFYQKNEKNINQLIKVGKHGA